MQLRLDSQVEWQSNCAIAIVPLKILWTAASSRGQADEVGPSAVIDEDGCPRKGKWAYLGEVQWRVPGGY